MGFSFPKSIVRKLPRKGIFLSFLGEQKITLQSSAFTANKSWSVSKTISSPNTSSPTREVPFKTGIEDAPSPEINAAPNPGLAGFKEIPKRFTNSL